MIIYKDYSDFFATINGERLYEYKRLGGVRGGVVEKEKSLNY